MISVCGGSRRNKTNDAGNHAKGHVKNGLEESNATDGFGEFITTPDIFFTSFLRDKIRITNILYRCNYDVIQITHALLLILNWFLCYKQNLFGR